MSRHRQQRPPINWRWEVRYLRNRWAYFWKPAIKKRLGL